MTLGATTAAYMERTGLSFDMPDAVKTINRLRPRVSAPSGTVLTFRVGGSMDLYGPIAWSAPVTYTVGTSVSADAFASGKFLAWRCDSTAAYSWRLEGLEMDFEPRGGW